jgi:hypothetical protein
MFTIKKIKKTYKKNYSYNSKMFSIENGFMCMLRRNVKTIIAKEEVKDMLQLALLEWPELWKE